MDLLTRFGIEKSRLRLLVMIGLLSIGTPADIGLSKRASPAIAVRAVIVAARFEGMDSERVEDLIAIPLERAAREIGEIDEVATLITTGAAQLNVVVAGWVPSNTLGQVFSDIRNRRCCATPA